MCTQWRERKKIIQSDAIALHTTSAFSSAITFECLLLQHALYMSTGHVIYGEVKAAQDKGILKINMLHYFTAIIKAAKQTNKEKIQEKQ